MYIFSLPLTFFVLLVQLEVLLPITVEGKLPDRAAAFSQSKTLPVHTASSDSPKSEQHLDGFTKPATRQDSQPSENRSIDSTRFIEVNEAYILGGGDRIALNFFNVPEYNDQHRIMVDGTVNLPLVGNIAIEGMTLKQASKAISDRYATELEYSIVTVNLVEPRAFQIAVAGEISQPGSYSLPAAKGGQFLTVAEAIQAAGGVTQIADLKRVEVRRRDREGATKTLNVNLLKLLEYGDLSPNATLRDGDTIFIPAANEIDLAEANQLAISNLRASTNRPTDVAVVGAVARPGPYRLKNTSGQPTLIQALQVAGGIEPSANLRQIRVSRQTRRGETKEIDVNLWQILQTGNLTQDLVLQSGDTITISTAEEPSLERITSLTSSSLATKTIQVNIVGEVESPGQQSLQANTTLNQAILGAGGISRGRGKKKVKLIRFNSNGTVSEQKIEVDLSREMNPETNPILKSNDVILVGRTAGAQVTDSLSGAFGVFRSLYPLPFLFSRYLDCSNLSKHYRYRNKLQILWQILLNT